MPSAPESVRPPWAGTIPRPSCPMASASSRPMPPFVTGSAIPGRNEARNGLGARQLTDRVRGSELVRLPRVVPKDERELDRLIEAELLRVNGPRALAFIEG